MKIFARFLLSQHLKTTCQKISDTSVLSEAAQDKSLVPHETLVTHYSVINRRNDAPCWCKTHYDMTSLTMGRPGTLNNPFSWT